MNPVLCQVGHTQTNQGSAARAKEERARQWDAELWLPWLITEGVVRQMETTGTFKWHFQKH